MYGFLADLTVAVHVAYVGFDDRKLGYQNTQLSILDLASGETRVLTASLDRGVDNPQWDGDRGVFFTFDDHGETKVGWIAARGGTIGTSPTPRTP